MRAKTTNLWILGVLSALFLTAVSFCLGFLPASPHAVWAGTLFAVLDIPVSAVNAVLPPQLQSGLARRFLSTYCFPGPIGYELFRYIAVGFVGYLLLFGVALACVRQLRKTTAAVAVLFVAVLFQACSTSSATSTSFDELGGDRSQRVAAVTKLLARHVPLPSTILDAHEFVETIGDGWFGPSDRVYFLQIQVPPGDLAHWTRHLSAVSDRETFAAQAKLPSWWVSPQGFQHLTFYQPASPLSATAHGWIGVSPADGQIFVFSFTM